VCGGDFNALRYPCERKGLDSGTNYRIEMEKFNDFIEKCQLLDIPAVSKKYTWYKPLLGAS